MHTPSSISLPAATGLPARERRMSLPRVLAVVFKLRIGFAIGLSAIGGAVLAAGQWPALLDTTMLFLAVLLSSSGAAGYNHLFERDIDACMGRTRERPFVSGRFQADWRWFMFFSAMITGGGVLGAWWFNFASGAFVVAGALTYGLVYTLWLKRRTHWNIVIGGAAGSWAVLAGAAATTDEYLTMPVLALALVLFLWTPSHFWSLAVAMVDDYRQAGVPMLPVTRGCRVAARWTLLNTLALVAATGWLVLLVPRPALVVGALVGSSWLLYTSVCMLIVVNRDTAMTAFKASLVQLLFLLAGLLIAYAAI